MARPSEDPPPLLPASDAVVARWGTRANICALGQHSGRRTSWLDGGMPNRSLWSLPLLVPIAALAGCGSVADPAPFQDSASTAHDSRSAASGTASPAAAIDNGSASAGATSTPPGTAAAKSDSTGKASQEGVAPLPISASPAPSGSPPTQPPPTHPPPANPPPVPPAPVSPADTDPTVCASYETGFLPLVLRPVCSSCHTATGSLPRFEPFASAEQRCASIGRVVASGQMPPRGGLSAEQRAVVASWVSLDCPETAAEAAQRCAQAPPNATPAATPPPAASGGRDDDDEDDDDDDDRGGDDD
jgi:hypothetical protein